MKLLKALKYRFLKSLKLVPALAPRPTCTKEIIRKARSFRTVRNSVQTLVLGSSHGFCGYQARQGEFNWCMDSQDLYYSRSIYKKYADLPSLKRVIAFYSVFSAGHILELTKEKDMCAVYKVVLDIPYRFERDEKLIESESIVKEFDELFPFIRKDKCGNNIKYNVFPVPVEERAAKHLKNNRRGNNQTAYVAEMAALAKAKGHEFYVVVPPFRSDYMALMPPFEETFKELLALDGVKIFNFFGNENFSGGDFGDTDHLNKSGAMKLTRLIRDKISAG